MNIDLFLNLAGIPGTSTNKNFAGQIELTGYSFDGKNSTNLASGSGGGSGKVALGPLVVTKPLDAASVPLFLALCNGMHIASATLTGVVAGAAGQALFKYVLGDIVLTEIASACSVTGLPSESVSLSFRTIQLSYIPQKPDGTVGTPVVGGWDVSKNAKV